MYNFSTESYSLNLLIPPNYTFNYKGRFWVKISATCIVVQKISLVTFPSNLEVRIAVKEKRNKHTRP